MPAVLMRGMCKLGFSAVTVPLVSTSLLTLKSRKRTRLPATIEEN
ncbi:hypothetical protein [Lysobacter gummosus]